MGRFQVPGNRLVVEPPKESAPHLPFKHNLTRIVAQPRHPVVARLTHHRLCTFPWLCLFTTYQWVWTGLNLGALGMFSLAFFEDHTAFPFRLLLTAAAWAAALACALYGLGQFHRRRHALLTVNDDPTSWESPQAPAVVVAVFCAMIGLMVVYAVASHQTFRSHGGVSIGGGSR